MKNKLIVNKINSWPCAWMKIPILIYDNVLLNKSIIFNNNKNKSGIYRWVNKINNKSYIGSATNLTKRLSEHLNKESYANKKSNLNLQKAFKKYGYSKFRLEILEYCNIFNLILKEQYYMDLLKPEYNILKLARSSLGFKHSSGTLLRFKNRDLGTGSFTMVINKKDNSTKSYDSIRQAAKALYVSHVSLLNYVNNNKLFKNTYLIICKEPNTKISETDLFSKNKDKCIMILDNSNNSIQKFFSKRKVAQYLSIQYNVIISVTTISKYIKSGKLYKNKYTIYI